MDLPDSVKSDCTGVSTSFSPSITGSSSERITTESTLGDNCLVKVPKLNLSLIMYAIKYYYSDNNYKHNVVNNKSYLLCYLIRIFLKLSLSLLCSADLQYLLYEERL